MPIIKEINCGECGSRWESIKERHMGKWNYCPNCGEKITADEVSAGYPDYSKYP